MYTYIFINVCDAALRRRVSDNQGANKERETAGQRDVRERVCTLRKESLGSERDGRYMGVCVGARVDIRVCKCSSDCMFCVCRCRLKCRR